ncbi:unnamed protein product [Rangifer tarandus platyrhynchus]|uniref:Uncharacterized protein n=1 Tax=Rangifer tarandus platyrhynchus TaxID=3082113 RepID=A0ABN8Y287_RANTA|nr:unnamed protein product [Rangifer tarandus platyrhynchus]
MGAAFGRRGGLKALGWTSLVAPGGFGPRTGARQDRRSGPRLRSAYACGRLRGPRAAVRGGPESDTSGATCP